MRNRHPSRIARVLAAAATCVVLVLVLAWASTADPSRSRRSWGVRFDRGARAESAAASAEDHRHVGVGLDGKPRKHPPVAPGGSANAAPDEVPHLPANVPGQVRTPPTLAPGQPASPTAPHASLGGGPPRSQLCVGWCPPKADLVERLVHDMDCAALRPIERLRTALQLENCAAATQSEDNAEQVAAKLEKLADSDAFIFFRGAAGLFMLDLMCTDPLFQNKRKTMPRVISNGDCHPGALRRGCRESERARKH